MLTYCCYDMRVINTPTMQNTFLIQSTDENNFILIWDEDKLLAAAANRLLELRKRYSHLTFKIVPQKQIVKSYA